MGWTDWFTGQGRANPANDFMGSQNVRDSLGQIDMGQQLAQNRQAPTIDPAFRNAQLQQMGQLQGIAGGTQQGAGELAVQRQMQNALAAQQANARMARGGNAGLAMRGAANQSAAVGLSGAGMGQQAALQDQTAAQGMLGQLNAQGRAGDLGVGQMQQQQGAINDQLQLGLLSQQTGLSIAQLQAQMNAYQAQMAKPTLGASLLSAGGQIGAAAAMHSDERLKTEIAEDGDGIDEMLDALRAKRYRYKDEKHGEGPRTGIMAQDLLKTKTGASVVRKLPDGLGIDINASLSAALASSARLNERLRKLEKRKVA